MQETWVQSLNQEDSMEKGMATHSNILAWKISWTEEPGYSPWGHNVSDMTEQLTHTHTHTLQWLKFVNKKLPYTDTISLTVSFCNLSLRIRAKISRILSQMYRKRCFDTSSFGVCVLSHAVLFNSLRHHGI